MYDPEESLKTSEDLFFFQSTADSVEERLGVGDPWSQRVRLAADIFDSVVRCEDDLANCFDEEREKALRVKWSELMSCLFEVLRSMQPAEGEDG